MWLATCHHFDLKIPNTAFTTSTSSDFEEKFPRERPNYPN